ncbi:MAG TPA: membrane protein insertase YidC, partial [Gemmatimonadales bacterium]|nr:membrane protein insertase YidC [Gemmatimonadales bacterium]
MDRRVLIALALMMAIALLPAVLFKRPPRRVPPADSAVTAVPPVAPLPPPVITAAPGADTTPARVVRVNSPLFSYGISTRGARLVESVLRQYRSLEPGTRDSAAQLMPEPSDVLGLRLVAGGDTLLLRDWDFSPSADEVEVTTAGTALTFSASRGEVTVQLVYRFRPDNYLISVDGRVTGLGPAGGVLLVGLGPGIANVESDSVEHQTNLAIVTKGARESEKKNFSSLEREAPTELGGPFQWVAVKSKYFVTALFSVDSTDGSAGRLSGVRAAPIDARRRPTRADIQVGLPVTAAGDFQYWLYSGPMEYDRLRGMGHDFYDVNPYGWPGFRTIIRPVAVGARWLLVKMRDFGIAYGWGLVLFGIFVRLALWPLNQKAMRASMAMQAVQPLMKDVQERYKNDPQRLQQEMFKLYKEHKVNPLGGCWPMLLPMPILFALFFVFQNTIELRGAPFLWLTDLSRPDPLYIIPVLMGVSMYAVTKIGQMGMPPNPQMKMMLYIMPVMMTV